ncbi:hypothetical protein [Longimicrobium terrae]|uniref:Lipoprotein n=1 Tax=Longimicrobium terrae TaxID=1639882 RepID=A0A841H1G3_9BACT|nr:hypothetical protein [Longimicrobium terrae]MBB4637388.1 hypothetical protein [Longimicrobium terrae]MBB6071786.1 hypothetical protein [Longimicrobium terrae]NNC28546.1 hypothetical protein [Longimicrobium terrae]
MKITAWILPALAAVACARGNPVPGEAAAMAASPDSLRGRVEVTGSEPATFVVLIPADGRAVALAGQQPVLRALAGVEVAVTGRRTSPAAFQVAAVTARSVDGIPVTDGVLVRDGERWFLRMTDGGRVPLSNLPDALRGREGARIWVTGPPQGPVQTFGEITGPDGGPVTAEPLQPATPGGSPPLDVVPPR